MLFSHGQRFGSAVQGMFRSHGLLAIAWPTPPIHTFLFLLINLLMLEPAVKEYFSAQTFRRLVGPISQCAKLPNLESCL